MRWIIMLSTILLVTGSSARVPDAPPFKSAFDLQMLTNYLLNDAFELALNSKNDPSFKIFVHNYAPDGPTAFISSDENTNLSRALVSDLGSAVSFFVEHDRGVTMLTIFSRKSPSSGELISTYTEHDLIPVTSSPMMAISTGSCRPS
jgi:hypothetical protein